MSAPWLVQVDLYAAFSLLGFILVCIPLYWHFEAWNVGCVVYIFWVGIQCLINFINIMVWRDNILDVAPVWCDITTRFRIGAAIGIPIASLVINRRLYRIANVSVVTISRNEKRRGIIVDLLIGLGIPTLAIALYWFYQGHRYDIIEGFGCVYAFPNVWTSYLLYQTWPIVIGLVSGAYAILTLRAFFKRRRQFSELMASNNNLTFNRYFRLMGLAGLELLCTIPLAIFALVSNARAPIYPWAGLEDLHYGFSRVNRYPAILWRANAAERQAMDFNYWTITGCAFAFFLFFGLAEEARKHYRLALSSVAKVVGITTFEKSSGFSSSGSKPTSSGFGRVTIPTFIQRGTRRGSMDSFSDKLSTNISIGGMDYRDMEELKLPPISPTLSAAPSSTAVSSPDDEKSMKLPSPVDAPVPALPVPAPVHSPTRRQADVPASVRPDSIANSIDMV